MKKLSQEQKEKLRKLASRVRNTYQTPTKQQDQMKELSKDEIKQRIFQKIGESS